MTPAGFARLAVPIVVAWLAIHALALVLLALVLLALVAGMVIAVKAVLGWLGQALVFALLLSAGAVLALWLWRAPRPLRLPRPA